MDRINPIRFTDNETGNTYELDFSRDAIRFAESKGFELEDVSKFPNTKIEELWFYSFRKNHKSVDRFHTNALLEKMGGVSTKVLERLMALYQQAAFSNVVQEEEDLSKNAKVTVEM